MGCACVKSDGVVKNQKINNSNQSKSSSIKKEIVGNVIKKESSNSNSKNR